MDCGDQLRLSLCARAEVPDESPGEANGESAAQDPSMLAVPVL